MTPTPREAEIERWPHRRIEGSPGNPTVDLCPVDLEPWPCPSQQYLDGLVKAVGRLRPYPGSEAEAGVTVHPSTTQRIEDFRAAVLAILRDDK